MKGTVTVMVGSFAHDGRQMLLEPPLRWVLGADSEGTFWHLDGEEAGIGNGFLCADPDASDGEVREEAQLLLAFEWQEYALEDDARLTPAAKRVKDALLARVKEAS